MTTILGYARVSTGDQDVAGQTMRLEQAGAIKVFTDVMSGKSMDRPGLAELLAYARHGDTLAVVRLDRLGRSLAELLSTVEDLRKRGIALLSLERRFGDSLRIAQLAANAFYRRGIRRASRRMQQLLRLDKFQSFSQADALVYPPPLAGMTHPIDIEPVRADAVQTRKGRIEFLAFILFPARAIALDEPVAATGPGALDVDRVIKRAGPDLRQAARL